METARPTRETVEAQTVPGPVVVTGAYTYGSGVCAACLGHAQAGHLMCARCWYRVPSRLRGEVYSALGAWAGGLITLEQLREVQDTAVKAVSDV